MLSCVHLNLFSKLALKSRLWTHHSWKNVRFKQLIRNPYSAFTIDSSRPTLRINLNEMCLKIKKWVKNKITICQEFYYLLKF
jgi:hypothetical protein